MIKSWFKSYCWKEVRRTRSSRPTVIDDGGFGWLPPLIKSETGDEIVEEQPATGRRRTIFIKDGEQDTHSRLPDDFLAVVVGLIVIGTLFALLGVFIWATTL